MARRGDIFADAIKSGVNSDAFKMGYAQQGEDERQRAEADAALARLIKGDKLKQEAIDANLGRAQAEAARTGMTPGKYSVNASENGFSLNPEPVNLRNFLRPLTPAQETAEKTAAKKIADFDAAGGRAGAEQNIKQTGEVLKDLESGKRDWWDRKVGGFLSGSPALMGTFASTEKARRDKVRSTALMMAKQSDPNPTEKQIDAIMGQIYDPSSSDEDNMARLRDYQSRLRNTNTEMDRSAQNLRETGYIMPGLAGGGRSPQAAMGDEDPGTIDDAGAEAAYQQAVRDQGRPETKNIGGHVYQRVNGGWKKVK